jgi:hypothetical protein
MKRVPMEYDMNRMITTYAHVILHLFESRSCRVGVVERLREDCRSRRRRETRRKRGRKRSRCRKRRSGVHKMGRRMNEYEGRW